jgi:hypothetical protein
MADTKVSALAARVPKECQRFLCCGCRREKPMSEAHASPDSWPHKQLFDAHLSDGRLVKMLKCRECVAGGR